MDNTWLMLQSLLPMILLQLPAFLVMLVGVILAIIHWRRNAKVSLLVIAALTLSIVIRIGGALQSVLIPMLYVSRQRLEIQRIGWLANCGGIVWSLLNALVLGLLLTAAFGWRKRGDTAPEDSESPA